MANEQAAGGAIGQQRYGELRASTTAIHDFFNRVGPWFYAVFFTAIGYRASLKYFMRANHHRLGLREHMAILDAGIGTGFSTVNLLRESPVALEVVGLDFAPGMLIGLKRWLAQYGFEDRVKLHLADMRHMPFSDETFDLIITSAAMEYLPEISEGISECGRVLRPGGKFLFIATRDSLMGKVIAATWKNKVLSPAYVTDCMKHAGMTRIETLRFPWYCAHVNWWGMVLLGEKAEELPQEWSRVQRRTRGVM
jgi:ubiquinone/menaquinone biosynthesis C-methylase UbiE